MKVTVNKEVAPKVEAVDTVHPLRKEYRVISSKSVNYEDLSPFEAITIGATFVLAITAGVLMSLPVA